MNYQATHPSCPRFMLLAAFLLLLHFCATKGRHNRRTTWKDRQTHRRHEHLVHITLFQCPSGNDPNKCVTSDQVSCRAIQVPPRHTYTCQHCRLSVVHGQNFFRSNGKPIIMQTQLLGRVAEERLNFLLPLRLPTQTPGGQTEIPLRTFLSFPLSSPLFLLFNLTTRLSVYRGVIRLQFQFPTLRSPSSHRRPFNSARRTGGVPKYPRKKLKSVARHMGGMTIIEKD